MTTTTESNLQTFLRKNKACHEAKTWAKGKTAEQAWDQCMKPDWLFWVLGKSGADRKQLVYAACQCARTALQYVPEGELRPLQAIEMAEKWVQNQAPVEDVIRYANSAADAAYSAYAAADAAYAAYAAYSADAAAAAAAAAAYAAYAAYAARKAMCQIIRDLFPFSAIPGIATLYE
jgi:hypothetical protein